MADSWTGAGNIKDEPEVFCSARGKEMLRKKYFKPCYDGTMSKDPRDFKRIPSGQSH